MSSKRERFYLYTEHYPTVIAPLSQEQKGNLFDRIFKYMIDGLVPISKSSPLEDMAFNVIKLRLDKDEKHYNDTCKKRSAAAKKGVAKRNKLAKENTLLSVSSRPSVARKQIAAVPIEDRKRSFAEEVYADAFLKKYDKEFLDKFFLYYSEVTNENGLMRYEEIKYDSNHGAFDVGVRLIKYKKHGDELAREAAKKRLQEAPPPGGFIQDDDPSGSFIQDDDYPEGGFIQDDDDYPAEGFIKDNEL